MTYKQEIFDTAMGILQERRRNAERLARENQQRFYAKCPQAAELKRGIQSTGSHAAKAVLQGGNVREQLELLRDANLGFQQSFQSLLTQNSLTPQDLEPNYGCALCGDKGYVDGLMCDCFKALLRKTSFAELNRRAPLSISNFSTFDTTYFAKYPQEQRTVMERIFSYCKNYSKSFTLEAASLLLQGRTGLGKTHLSLAIAGEVMEKGFGVLYNSVHNVVSAVEQQRFQNPEEASDSLMTCDLLILDDLGTEFVTSYTQATLYNIIDTRIMQGLPTIISTNLTMEELQKRYSERLVSRMFGAYQRLGFVGQDVRYLKKMLAANI